MIYLCDTCQKVYELNRIDVSCIYCGAYACHPYEPLPNTEE